MMEGETVVYKSSRTQRSLHRFLNQRYLAILTTLIATFVVVVFFLRYSAMDETTDYYLYYDAQVLSDFYQVTDEILEFDSGIKEYYWGVSRLPKRYQEALDISNEDSKLENNRTYIYQQDNKLVYVLPYFSVDKNETFFVIHLFDLKSEAMFYQSWHNIFILLVTLSLILVISYSLHTNRQVTRQMSEFHQWVKSIEHVNDHQLLSPPQTLTFEELIDSAQCIQVSLTAQYELQQKQQALLEREKHFLSSLSHELRTPIAITSAAVTLLKKSDSVSLKDREKLDKLSNANLAMKQLTHTLLQLWRGQQHVDHNQAQTPLERKIFLLDDLIEQGIEHCQQQFKRRNICFNFISHENTKLFAQYELVEILINNLLRNACQYTADFTITIDLFKDHFIIENMVDKSAYNDVSDNNFGYGLGLFLAEQICQHMQWEIEITSPEQRFTVKVTFNNIVE